MFFKEPIVVSCLYLSDKNHDKVIFLLEIGTRPQTFAKTNVASCAYEILSIALQNSTVCIIPYEVFSAQASQKYSLHTVKSRAGARLG